MESRQTVFEATSRGGDHASHQMERGLQDRPPADSYNHVLPASAGLIKSLNTSHPCQAHSLTTTPDKHG